MTGAGFTDGAAEADLGVLREHALEQAARLLHRFGEFHPFGIAVTTDGEVRQVMAVPEGAGEYPRPEDVLGELWGQLREHRAEYRGVVTVANASAPDGSDGVRLEYEHASGVARMELVTYRRRLLGRALRYLQPHLGPSQARIWG